MARTFAAIGTIGAAAIFLSACVSSEENRAPTIQQLSIGEGPYYTNDNLRAVPEGIRDPEGAEISVNFAWFVNGEPVPNQSAEELAGAFFEKGDTVYCIATPNDGFGDGEPVESNHVVIRNSKPKLGAATLSPGPYVAGSTIKVIPEGFSDDDGDEPAYRYEWIAGGVRVADQISATYSGVLVKGTSLAVRVIPGDGEDEGAGVVSSPVVIENTPPRVSSITIGNGPYYRDSVINAAASANDLDHDAVSLAYQWFADGFPINGFTTATLPANNVVKGQQVVLRVTATDSSGASTTADSNVVTVQNSKPAMTVAIANGPLNESSTIQAVTTTTDIDNDPVSIAYVWYVDGVSVPVAGKTITGAHFNKNQTVKVRAIPFDGADAGSEVVSNTVTIANTLPVVTANSLGSGPFYETSTLTPITAATDADGDPITFTYEWWVAGSAVPSYSARTLNGTYFNKAQSVYVVIRPFDGQQYGQALTSPAVTILNSAPVAPTVTILGGPYYRNSAISASVGAADPDGDGVSYSYQWYADGSPLAGRTGTTLPGGVAQKGNQISVRVVASDGASQSAEGTSNAVTIQNSAPTMTLALGTGPWDKTSTISAITTTNDIDGDTVTINYVWNVAGSAVPVSGNSITGAHFSRGNAVYVNATPFDGQLMGSPQTSNTVVIVNARPVVSTVSLDGANYYEASTITPVTAVTDADGDSVTLSYEWWVDGVPLSSYSDRTLDGTCFDRDQSVALVVRPFDGAQFGQAVTSAAVTILNTPPLLSSVAIPPGTYYADSSIQATASGLFDIDGDYVTVEYKWYVDGNLRGGTSNVLQGAFSKGSAVYAVGTPTDSFEPGSAKTSNTVSIANKLPPPPTVEIMPAQFAGSGKMYAMVVSQPPDADNDALTYSYHWLQNGFDVPFGPAVTDVAATYLATGDLWQVIVTVSDGSPTPVTAWATQFAWPITWKQIAGGGAHHCAIDEGDRLWCWGDNLWGQLGDATVAAKDEPVRVGSYTGYADWQTVSTSASHTCAIRGGNLYCWGANASGQVGGGFTSAAVSSPTVISSNWTAVAPGANHTCGIQMGSAYCWGSNNPYYQLGNGTLTSKPSPALVAGGYADWVTISAGETHSCGIRATGALYCWGSGDQGQLGAGAAFFKTTPFQIGLAKWKSVSASYSHTCGIQSDGSLWCWGGFEDGKLGTASAADEYAPKRVQAYSGRLWAQVRAGKDHTCGLRQDGTQWCWGRGWNGQIGVAASSITTVTEPRMVWSAGGATGTLSTVTLEGATASSRGSSVDVGPDGALHVAYIDAAATDRMRYATNQSGVWQISNPDWGCGCENPVVRVFGSRVNLMYGLNGTERVWHRDLAAAYNDWLLDHTVSTSPWSGNNDADYGLSGPMIISTMYTGSSQSSLVYIVYSGGWQYDALWQRPAYDGTAHFGPSSIVADPIDGSAHILSFDDIYVDLSYWHDHGHTKYTIQGENEYYQGSLAVDGDGNLHAVYRISGALASPGILRYAKFKRDGTILQKVDINSNARQVYSKTIKVDALGRVHLSFVDGGGTAYYMTNASGAWTTGLGATQADSNATFVDDAGRVFVSYVTSSDSTAKVWQTEYPWQSVAAAASSSCGLRSDNSLWCWGANSQGQLGVPGAAQSRLPVRVGRNP